MDRRFRAWLSAVGARSPGVLLACLGVALALGVPARSAAPGRAPSFAVAKDYAAGKAPGGVSIADLNGDGRPDVVTTNPFGERGNSVSVLLNRGDGSLATHVEYRVGAHPALVLLRDLNGDDRPDLAAVNGYGIRRVSIRLNRGDGRFSSSHLYLAGGKPHSGDPGLVASDLNGDKRPDLVSWGGGGRAVSVLINRGDGAFEQKADYRVGEIAGASYGGVAVSDLNGDHAPDLAVANAKAKGVSVFLNKGDGAFAAKRDYATGRDPDGAIEIADLDGNGRPDVIALSCRSGSVSVLLNKGGGAFRHARDHPLGVCGGLVAVADLNGDRRPDLVWITADTRGVVVLINRGPGTFEPRRLYPAVVGCLARDVWPSGDCGQIDVRDVNGDGRPDLAVARTGANAVDVLLNRGNGSFAAKLSYRSLSAPIAFGVADLNHDGRQDLVTANYGARSVGVLLNKPGLCNVQDVKRETLQSARQELARANCRVGKVGHANSTVATGRVISQKPTFGAVLPKGGKVTLVVNLGKG